MANKNPSHKFPKGNKGRPKGSKNWQTRELKTVISYILGKLDDPTIDKMLKDLLENNPAVVLNFVAKISPANVALHLQKAPDFEPSPIKIEFIDHKDQVDV
jgi:hypothetical protein